MSEIKYKGSTAVKELVTKGAKKGFVTYEELSHVLSEEELKDSEHIEDTILKLEESGIYVIKKSDEEEADEIA